MRKFFTMLFSILIAVVFVAIAVGAAPSIHIEIRDNITLWALRIMAGVSLVALGTFIYNVAYQALK